MAPRARHWRAGRRNHISVIVNHHRPSAFGRSRGIESEWLARQSIATSELIDNDLKSACAFAYPLGKLAVRSSIQKAWHDALLSMGIMVGTAMPSGRRFPISAQRCVRTFPYAAACPYPLCSHTEHPSPRCRWLK